MNILYFQGLDEPDSPRVELESVTRYSEDRSMAEFENTELSHVDWEQEGGWATLYCKGGFYVVLSHSDVAELVRVALSSEFNPSFNDAPDGYEWRLVQK